MTVINDLNEATLGNDVGARAIQTALSVGSRPTGA
jgi:hypothetical protein